VKGFSHITGGGIIGNTTRIIPSGLSLNIFWSNWKLPKIFKLIQAAGEVEDEEMRKVFNLGIGLIAVVSRKDLKKTMALAEKLREKPVIVGEVI
jgi:phosphoribosylformylglycinamidine cyclo-ligase